MGARKKKNTKKQICAKLAQNPSPESLSHPTPQIEISMLERQP